MNDIAYHAKNLASAGRLMKWRHRNDDSLWTDAEDDVCRRQYPDYKALLKALPERTMGSLKWRCRKLGITPKLHIWTCAENSRFRKMWRRSATMEELLQAFPFATKRMIRSRACDLRLGPRPRVAYKPTGIGLLDALRAECVRRNMVMADLDEFTGSNGYFQGHHWSGHFGRVNHQMIEKAIAILGGTVTVEWRGDE
ncbi:hypothetical protein ACWGS9_19850 [Bradyrhizobium sp. Arg314]